jgi:hypothetical protein
MKRHKNIADGKSIQNPEWGRCYLADMSVDGRITTNWVFKLGLLIPDWFHLAQ